LKLLITGASGFIGSAFVGAALAAGHDVAVLGRDPDAWRLRPYVGCFVHRRAALGDAEAVMRILSETAPEIVVHLAWAGVAGSDRNAPVQIDNIGCSAGLLLAAANAGARHFVSTGSQAEYGPETGIISPAVDPHPTTLYGEAKLATYRLLRRLALDRGMRLSWLRVFSTYGPGDHPYWMIPTLINALLRGERPALTKGEQRWDFLHVADAARALLLVAESEVASGVFNLGSGSAPPLRDTILAIRDAIDPALPLGFGELAYRSDQVMHLEADISRLYDELGWRPGIPLAEGLLETVRWYTNNRWIFGADL
jgi:nucleoside-diphosphate-sugar epimerase